MIIFNYEHDFLLQNETKHGLWITEVILSEGKTEGDISFIFCNDEYLHKINLEYLNHDTLTDIITFDYCVGNEISGDIFISIDRVKDNALDFSVDFNNELLRVLSHGILHLIGYKDKTDADRKIMKTKEDEKIKMFHVEL